MDLYEESDMWAVNASASLNCDNHDTNATVEFFAINTFMLWTTIPDEVYESFIGEIVARNIELVEIPATESPQVDGDVSIPGSIDDDSYVRIPNCREYLNQLPTVYITVHNGRDGPAVRFGIEPEEYIPDLDTCTITIRGLTVPRRNYSSYFSIGENFLRKINIAFDRENSQIGFCDR